MRKFLYNISTVAFGNFFNAALGFFYIAAVAKALTLEDFGKYSILSATLVGIAKLTDFGVNNVFVATSFNTSSSPSFMMSSILPHPTPLYCIELNLTSTIPLHSLH